MYSFHILLALYAILNLIFVESKDENLIERQYKLALEMQFPPEVTLIKREYKDCIKIPCSTDKHCTSALAKSYNENCVGCHNGMCYDSSKQMAKRKSIKKGSSSSSSKKEQEKEKSSSKPSAGTTST